MFLRTSGHPALLRDDPETARGSAVSCLDVGLLVLAVLRVIPGFHPLYKGVDPELLALIDDHFAHGFFRDWATFTHTAQRICQQHDRTLDEPIARAVFALHDGGRGAS